MRVTRGMIFTHIVCLLAGEGSDSGEIAALRLKYKSDS